MGAFPFLLLSLAMLAVAPGQSGHPAALTRSGELRDLTGTWISVSDKNATDVATASQLPNALLKISAGDDKVSIERSWSGPAIPATFVCDGRENSNGYSIVVERTTCRWDASEAGRLIIEGSIGRANGTVTGRLRERYWVDAGDGLTVERSREVFSLKRGPTITTSRYRRVPS
jgi:hypothetical protein